MIQGMVWGISLLSPIAVLATMVALNRMPDAGSNGRSIVGAVAAFFIGLAGTYHASTRVIGALLGSEEIAVVEITAAWYRMWYPVAMGLSASIAIALLAYRRTDVDDGRRS
jgi:hypothetical protein